MRMRHRLASATLFFALIAGAAFAGGGEDKSGVRPQALKLPDGPGSITGLGESFESQLNSGTGSYRVPLVVPPGRAGLAPELVLTYSGGTGNNAFGLGWTLSLGRVDSIQRQTDKGLPVYDDDMDVFVASNGEELVKVDETYYRAENESTFDRFERLDEGDCTGGWKAWHRDGNRSFYGCTDSARIKSGPLTFKWLLERREDANGNSIFYRYNEPQAFQNGAPSAEDIPYLTSIEYNQSRTSSASMRIDFKYEARPDKLYDYRSRFGHSTSQRCVEVIMSAGGVRARSYALVYEDTSTASCLVSVSQYGRVKSQGPLPSILRFSYSSFELGNTLTPMSSGLNPSVGLTNTNVDIVDMDGDALPDLLYTGDVHEVYLNRGGTGWAEPYEIDGGFSTQKLQEANTFLLDMDGDGFSDLFEQDPSINGYRYFRGGQENNGWASTQAEMENSPCFVIGEKVKTIDLDNDGRMDVMRKLDNDSSVTCWFNRQGERFVGPVVLDLTDGVALTSDMNFGPEASSSLRLSDMNGDGIQDLLALVGEGFIRYLPGRGVTLESGGLPNTFPGWDGTPRGPWSPNDPNASGVLMENAPDQFDNPALENLGSFRQLIVVDANGDGLSDLAFVANNQLDLWLNVAGKGFSEPYTIGLESNIVPDQGPGLSVRVADMNGNGTNDLVWNNQAGFSELSLPNVTWIYLDLSGGIKPNLLTGINNGIGGTTQIEYESAAKLRAAAEASGEHWSSKLPVPVNVVSKITTGDGMGNFYVTENVYRDGFYDGVEKEFRGFAGATQTEVGDDAQGAPSLVNEFRFFTGGETPEQLTEAGLDPESIRVASLKGRPWFSAAKDINGAVFHKIQNTWDTRDLFVVNPAPENPWRAKAVTFTFMTQERKSIQEKLGPESAVEILKEMEYDDFGNMTRLVEHGRLDGDWDDERVTTTSYTAQSGGGSENWNLDRLVTRLVTDESGVKVADQRNYYDNMALHEVVEGNLTRTEDWVEGEHWVNSLRQEHDEYGNVVADYDPLFGQAPGHLRTYRYDDEYQTYPVEERIETGTRTLVFTANYDFAFGQVTEAMGLNGHTTYFHYDNFGRLSSSTKPPDTLTTTEYSYVLARVLGGKLLNWIETRQRDGSADGFLVGREYVDGLGRKLMIRTEGEEAGQVVVTDAVAFNARRSPQRQYLPYFDSGSLDYTQAPPSYAAIELVYDALGRSIQMTQPDGAFATTLYEPLAEVLRDEEQSRTSGPYWGNFKRLAYDGLFDTEGQGRLRILEEHVQLTDTGESGPLTTWTTRYRYDLLDNFTGYTDTRNNSKHMQYDGLSRMVFMNDPDRSHLYFDFDDAGNVIRRMDAKGQSIFYDYDGVNRVLAEFYDARDATPEVAYHYDDDGGSLPTDYLSPEENIQQAILEGNAVAGYDVNNDAKVDVADIVAAAKKPAKRNKGGQISRGNTLGRLAWVRDESGEEHFSYDERDRPVWSLKRIWREQPGGDLASYLTTTAYDPMDRPTRITYPDSSRIDYVYNSRGLLESIPGIVEGLDYDPAGQKQRVALACGVTTTHTYDARFRLKRILSTRSLDGAKLQDLNYAYDAVSNITGIIDGLSTNDLSRIGQEVGASQEEATTLRATQSFQYDALYRLTKAANPVVYGTLNYRYNPVSNMIRQTADLIEPNDRLNVGDMAYGGDASRNGRAPGESPGPHAFTASTPLGGGGSALNYAYDNNGSVIEASGATLHRDIKDRLSRYTKNDVEATYTYDYAGRRRLKRVESNETPKVVRYASDIVEQRGTTLHRYVQLGDLRVAMANEASTGNATLHPSTFYLRDHLGSTDLTLDESGRVVEAVRYYPYGSERKRLANLADGTRATYSYIDRERDRESALIYLETRFLQSEVARLLRVDELMSDPASVFFEDAQLSNPQTLNGYSYSLNNPIVNIDQDGRKTVTAEPGSIRAEDAMTQIRELVGIKEQYQRANYELHRAISWLHYDNVKDLDPKDVQALRDTLGQSMRANQYVIDGIQQRINYLSPAVSGIKEDPIGNALIAGVGRGLAKFVQGLTKAVIETIEDMRKVPNTPRKTNDSGTKEERRAKPHQGPIGPPQPS